MTAQPRAAARKWSVQHEASTTQLGDTFGFELRDGHSRQAQLRGLLRVHSAEAAFKLLRASGKVDGDGRRWFVEPVYGELPGLVQGVLWHDWQENEDWQGFANRVARLSEDGVILGRRQLGSRVARGDARLKDRPSVWRASKVPREWRGDMVVEIFASVGFRNAEVVQKLRRNKTTDWIVRAVAPSDAELFQSCLQDATGATHEIDLIKEARRRPQHTSSRPLPGETAVSFKSVPSLRRDNRTTPDAAQKDAAGDQTMQEKEEEEDKAKRAKIVQSAKAAEAPQPKKSKGPWMGDCMMLAIADALRRYAPEEKASGRSVRAFLATFYAKHFQEYEALWDGVKPGAKNKEDAGDWKGSFQDYIDGFKICGTWCCYLELRAAAHALRRDIYVKFMYWTPRAR